ncbi:MAG: outer membrane lipoprotein-sorting protein [Spirochaetota bacterium]
MTKKIFLPLLIIILTASAELYALTAKEIIVKSDNAVRGATQYAAMTITIKTRRWTRTLVIKSWSERDSKKSFAEILSPEKDAGTRFLLMNKNMWQYLPKLQQTVKISPSMMMQSWMGSDLTNDDIVKESSIINDYTHEIIGTDTIDGILCWKLSLVPKPDAAVVWGRIIYYARQPDCLPVREEFYNERDQLKKTMTCGSVKAVRGRVIPTVYKVESTGKADQYTLMEITDAAFDTPLPGRIFTMQNLQRR